jgi:carbon-monoxide dehydrogenase large subunit
MRYDADAQPLTTTLADYLVPMAKDVPDCIIEHVETPNPLNPLGVKGAGEGGAIPAPAAIIAAVEDALSPFGVHFAEMPLTPDRIVAVLRAAGACETLRRAGGPRDRQPIAAPGHSDQPSESSPVRPRRTDRSETD